METGQNEKQAPQTVRFKSQNDEIEPSSAVQTIEPTTSSGDTPREEISPEAEEELRNLSKSLQTARLQAKRLENFAFEPVSLPVSRVGDLSSYCSLNCAALFVCSFRGCLII